MMDHSYRPRSGEPGSCFRAIMMECPICKKDFFCTNQGMWVYKITDESGKYTFCSWTCMRKYEREHESKPDGRKKNHFRGRRIAG